MILIQSLEPEKNLVVSRKNDGLGDVIMCLPVFEAIHKLNPDINLFFDVKEKYGWLLEKNPYCSIYQGQPKDLYYDFNDGFEGHHETKHRTDFFADFLGVELHDKKPHIYNGDFSMSNFEFLPQNYTLLFLRSANFLRQIMTSVMYNILGIFDDIGSDCVLMSSNSMLWNDRVISLEMQDLAPLVKNSSLCIGVDSGPMHVAGAFNVPFLVFTNVIDPMLRYAYYNEWDYMRTCLSLDCLYKCGHDCSYDFPPPCLKFFDFQELKHKICNLMRV